MSKSRLDVIMNACSDAITHDYIDLLKHIMIFSSVKSDIIKDPHLLFSACSCDSPKSAEFLHRIGASRSHTDLFPALIERISETNTQEGIYWDILKTLGDIAVNDHINKSVSILDFDGKHNPLVTILKSESKDPEKLIDWIFSKLDKSKLSNDAIVNLFSFSSKKRFELFLKDRENLTFSVIKRAHEQGFFNHLSDSEKLDLMARYLVKNNGTLTPKYLFDCLDISLSTLRDFIKSEFSATDLSTVFTISHELSKEILLNEINHPHYKLITGRFLDDIPEDHAITESDQNIELVINTICETASISDHVIPRITFLSNAIFQRVGGQYLIDILNRLLDSQDNDIVYASLLCSIRRNIRVNTSKDKDLTKGLRLICQYLITSDRYIAFAKRALNDDEGQITSKPGVSFFNASDIYLVHLKCRETNIYTETMIKKIPLTIDHASTLINTYCGTSEHSLVIANTLLSGPHDVLKIITDAERCHIGKMSLFQLYGANLKKNSILFWLYIALADNALVLQSINNTAKSNKYAEGFLTTLCLLKRLTPLELNNLGKLTPVAKKNVLSLLSKA